MKKQMLLLIAAVLLVALAGGQTAVAQDDNAAITVAVGVVPEAAFVDAVAGGLVNTVTLIPPGYSPANYQPTAKEMQALSDARIYFTLQMPTEQANILPKVQDFNPDILIVDLRESVLSVYPLLNTSGEEIESTEGQSVDPHVWLSPKRSMVMVQTIADELSAVDEGNRDTYQANAAAYIEKLTALDSEIQEKVSSLSNPSFLIYHAAYNYFAKDYGLEMIAIEIEGKQATAEELQSVISLAKENGITTVFYQDEFDDSQAATVAEEIGGVVQNVAPLSMNYIQGLEDFVSALAQSKK